MVMGITAVATRAADFMEVAFAVVADSMVEVDSMEAVGSTVEVDSMAVADPTVVVDTGNALPSMKHTTAGGIELPAIVLLLSRTPVSWVSSGFGCRALYPAPAFLLECRLANRGSSKMKVELSGD
jgi:hypothetical protein